MHADRLLKGRPLHLASNPLQNPPPHTAPPPSLSTPVSPLHIHIQTQLSSPQNPKGPNGPKPQPPPCPPATPPPSPCRLVKAMEDMVIRYGGTVRNSQGDVVQFLYGEDGMDATRIEGQMFEYLKWDVSHARRQYGSTIVAVIPVNLLVHAVITTVVRWGRGFGAEATDPEGGRRGGGLGAG